MNIVFRSSGVLCFVAATLCTSGYTQQVLYPEGTLNESAKTQAMPLGTEMAGGAKRDPKLPYAPIELRPRSGRLSFHVRGDRRSVISQILGDFDILIAMDSSVKGREVSFDGDDLTFVEAADLVKLVTGTFFVPLDPHRVLVLADTRENRSQFEHLVEKKIYVPGVTKAEATEMNDIAHAIFDVKHGFAQDSNGRITIRAPEEDGDAMRSAFAELFEERSELQLEVRICEVERTDGTNTGTVLPNSATLFNVRSEINSIIASNVSLVDQIIASGLASAGDYSAILAALLASGELTGTVFNNPFALFGGGLTETGAEWNTTSANMLLASSDFRSLNQMQLRVLDGEEATFRSGQRYPVMTSSYTAVSSSSSSTSTLTVPQVQYQDLGLTLKVKPSIRSADAVSLNVDLKVSSLAGSTINNIPVLANRQYSGTFTVHFGGSALIVSAMSRQDARAITGYPGLDDIPSVSSGTNRQDSMDRLDLVVLVTPHLIRLSHPESASNMLVLPFE